MDTSENEALYNAFLAAPWLPDFQSHRLRCGNAAPQLECVIVEPRCHPCLKGVLYNISTQFPLSALTVYHSSDNRCFVQNIVGENNNVHLVEFTDGNISRDDYNTLLTSRDFWRDRCSKSTLIFQTDTGVRKNRILKFMHYGYVGAPWTWTCLPSDQCIRYGNGGLSLRNTRLMQDIVNLYDPIEGWNEDVFFSKHAFHWTEVPAIGAEEASSFSVEYNSHPDPMGFHQAWRLHPHNTVKTWFSELEIEIGEGIELFNIESVHIVSERGHKQPGDAELKVWIEAGISHHGVHIPKGSQPPFTDPFPGLAKHLVLGIGHPGLKSALAVKVPLIRGSVSEDVDVHWKTKNEVDKRENENI